MLLPNWLGGLKGHIKDLNFVTTELTGWFYKYEYYINSVIVSAKLELLCNIGLALLAEIIHMYDSLYYLKGVFVQERMSFVNVVYMEYGGILGITLHSQVLGSISRSEGGTLAAIAPCISV